MNPLFVALGVLLMSNTWFAGLAATVVKSHGPVWQVATFIAFFVISFASGTRWVAMWALMTFAGGLLWWKAALFSIGVAFVFLVLDITIKKQVAKSALR